MVSPVASSYLFDRQLLVPYSHHPGANTAQICTPDSGTTKRSLDLSLYGGFAVLARNQALTGAGITRVEIVAAEDAAMATNVTVIKDSGVVVTNDLNKYVALECDAKEVRSLGDAAGFKLRYVAARLTLANAADEAAVMYVGIRPTFPTAGITASSL